MLNSSNSSFNTIPERCFNGCSGLSGELEIPKAVTTIGASAFNGCATFSMLKFEDTAVAVSIGEAAFWGCKGFSNAPLKLPQMTEIAADTFKGCENIASIDFPSNIETIGDRAFDGCMSIADYQEIPASVKTIRKGAFFNTRKMYHVVFLGDAPEILGHATEAEDLRSFDNAANNGSWGNGGSPDILVYTKQYANGNYKWPKNNDPYVGYPTALRAENDTFNISEERDPLDYKSSATGGAITPTAPYRNAMFLYNGSSAQDFSDHTLVIKDDDDDGGDLKGAITDALTVAANQSLKVYDISMIENYETIVAKKCGHTFTAQITLELPASMDLTKGFIKGVYIHDNNTNKIISATTTKQTVDGVEVDCVQFTTDLFCEVGILYEDNARTPNNFYIKDSRQDPKPYSNTLRAGFANTTTAVDTTKYEDYYLEIEDDKPLAELRMLLTQLSTIQGYTFSGYDIKLMYDDGTTVEPKTAIPGINDHRLNIRVPLPTEVTDAMNAAGDPDATEGELFAYTTPDGYVDGSGTGSVESVAYSLTDVGAAKCVEFTVTHFSEFGFLYVPKDAAANLALPFEFVDKRDTDSLSVEDRGRKTSTTFTTTYNGDSRFDGMILEIEDVTDTTGFTGGTSPVVTLSNKQHIKVYNLTLKDSKRNPVPESNYPSTPLTVTIPVPYQTEDSSGTVTWLVRNNTAVEALRYKDDAGTNVKDDAFSYSIKPGNIETVEFLLERNGQVALIYTEPDYVVGAEFEVIWDENNVTTESSQDTWRIDTGLLASYEGKTEAGGYKLKVEQVAHTNFTTNATGLDPLVTIGGTDQKEITVYNFTLYDPSGNVVEPPVISSLGALRVTMPVLTEISHSSGNINWDLNNGSVEAMRYEEITGGRRYKDEAFGSPAMTTPGGIPSFEFDLTKNGEVAFVYTPDLSREPLKVIDNRSDKTGTVSATFGTTLDQTRYAGYTLTISDPGNPVLTDPLVSTSGGKAVKSYLVTLRDYDGNEVNDYSDDLSVILPVPAQTGSGSSAVTWDETTGTVTGIMTYYNDGVGNVLDSTTIGGSKIDDPNVAGAKVYQFTIGRNIGRDRKTNGYGNGEYGMLYTPTPVEPIEFLVLDQRSDASKNGADASAIVSNEPNFTENRYLILKDSSGPELMPVVNADNELNWYKEHVVYDIVFKDQRTGGQDETDHGTTTITVRAPRSMDLTNPNHRLRVVTFQRNSHTQLEKTIPVREKINNGIQEIQFDTTHFTDYAILYYDQATNPNPATSASTATTAATNATTGASGATGATTGATSGTTNSGATNASTGASGSGSTNATTGASGSGGGSGSTNSGSGSGSGSGSSGKPDMPRTGDPGMYRMMGSAGLGLFGLYELISSIRVRERRSRRRLYRR
ncbi:MAG: leucine-rich repeat domain-containing protein [Lachnospiraceae bacterium]|nr:leucine-rich repeat domain-containing protein [Lachnospiraceae bacterium]